MSVPTAVSVHLARSLLCLSWGCTPSLSVGRWVGSACRTLGVRKQAASRRCSDEDTWPVPSLGVLIKGEPALGLLPAFPACRVS